MFLNPVMTLGALAVSVPVIIHLLNNRRVQRIRWAAMRFLRASHERNRRRMRAEDLLLLILRCAIVLCLAFALARPVLRGSAGAGGLLGSRAAVAAVIVIDNSASMATTDGVTARFDLAKRAAGQVIDTLPSGSSVAVWTCSDSPQPLIPDPTLDLAAARAAVRDARLADRASDIVSAVGPAFDTLAARTTSTFNREIYLITDGQALAWKDLNAARRLFDARRDVALGRIVFVAGNEEHDNVAVTGIALSSPLAAADRTARFTVDVRNTGRSVSRDVQVRLFVDADVDSAAGQPQAVAEGVVDGIDPGQTKTLALSARLPAGAEQHVITAAIAPDRVPGDDSRSMALRTLEQVRVLLVDGDSGRGEPRDSEVFFLRSALRPSESSERALISAEVVRPTDLSAQDLSRFDVIVLANVPELDSSTADSLARFVREGDGRGLFIFPGDAVDATFYNRELGERLGIMPAVLGEAVGDPKSDTPMLHLLDRELGHPIASVWRGRAADVGSPSAASFYRAVRLDEPVDTRARVVLRFSDNSPAVIEGAAGRGRVILFSSTADTAWNDLPVKPGVFVPLLHRAIAYVVSKPDETMTLRTGERLVIPLSDDAAGAEWNVASPSRDGKRAASVHRAERINGQVQFTIEDTDRAGAYRIEKRDPQSTAPSAAFAVQPDPAESELRLLTADERASLNRTAAVIEFDPARPLGEAVAQARVGTELWLPVVLVALSLAAGETVLAAWFSRAK